MECEKCYSRLYDCPDCKGNPGQTILGDPLICSQCDEGRVCSDHGRFWRR
ncbi:hypothetical protein [Nocardiopsis valliformis]|nr:hypothetical protein [Nocardiopsis valliformis]